MEEMIDFYEQKAKEYMEKYFSEREKYELLKLRVKHIIETKNDEISKKIKEIIEK